MTRSRSSHNFVAMFIRVCAHILNVCACALARVRACVRAGGRVNANISYESMR
jgi:hypothetical protein